MINFYKQMYARGKRWISQSNVPGKECVFLRTFYRIFYQTNKSKITGAGKSSLGKDSSVGFWSQSWIFPKKLTQKRAQQLAGLTHLKVLASQTQWSIGQLRSTKWNASLILSCGFADVDFDGSLLPLFISWCYNHGIKKLPNHWWTRLVLFSRTSNTMTC